MPCGGQKAKLAVIHPNFPKPSPYPLVPLWVTFPNTPNGPSIPGVVNCQRPYPGGHIRDTGQAEIGCPKQASAWETYLPAKGAR